MSDTDLISPIPQLGRNISKEQYQDLKDNANAPKDIAQQAQQAIDTTTQKFPHSKEECHATPFSHLDIRKRIVQNCDKLIEKRKEIIKKLNELRNKVKKHFELSRTSKTGSTITGVVGSVLLFTPFAPVGVGMLGASTIAGLSTTINDILKSKGYNRGISDFIKEEEPFAKELQEDLKTLMEAAQKYADETGTSFEDATAKIVTGMKRGNIAFSNTLLGSTHRWSEFKSSLDFAGGSVSKDKFGMIAKASATSLTKSLSIVGYAFDVVDCVNSWQSNHPTMDAIDRVIKDLESGNRELELLQIIFS